MLWKWFQTTPRALENFTTLRKFFTEQGSHARVGIGHAHVPSPCNSLFLTQEQIEITWPRYTPVC